MNNRKDWKTERSSYIVGVITLIGLGTAFGFHSQGQNKKGNLPDAPAFSHSYSSITADPDAHKRAIELKRPSREALDLAYARYDAGDLSGCLKASKHATSLAQQPNVSASTTVLLAERLSGRVLLRMGKPREALAMLRRRWRAGEDPRGVDLDIALCYIRLGDHKRAAQFYSDRAILDHSHLVSPSDLPQGGTTRDLEARVLLARGGSFFSSGRRDEAARDYEAVVRLSPRNALAHYRLAVSLPPEKAKDRSIHFAYAFFHGSPKIRRKAQSGLASVDRATQRESLATAKLIR